MKFLACLFCVFLGSLSFASYVEKHIKKGEGKWTVDVSYPRFGGTGALVRFANADIARRVHSTLSEMTSSFKEDAGNPDTLHASLETHCVIELDTKDLISVLLVDNSYFHGHVGWGFQRLNYGLVNGKPKILKLKDIVSDPHGVFKLFLKEVHRLKLDFSYPKGFIEEGEKDRRELFLITKKGLDYDPMKGESMFDPSADSIILPWSKVPGLKRNGPIASLLKKRR